MSDEFLSIIYCIKKIDVSFKYKNVNYSLLVSNSNEVLAKYRIKNQINKLY